MKKKKTKVIKNYFFTFDIETTTLITGINEKNELERNAILYSSQFYDGKNYNQFRTLDDTIDYLKKINNFYFNKGLKVVIYVHNLAYEFQFIKDFFEWEKILCLTKRKIITAETEAIVFRCSYMLSNMSLRKFLESEGVAQDEQKTTMNYKTKRFPWTKLTKSELKYCKNDVVGLHSAISIMCKKLKFNMQTIPITSTGFVRNDCRKESQRNYKNRLRFLDEKLSFDMYKMLKNAFRGGNTHANRRNANKVLTNVASFDRKSAYPYELLTQKFPTTFHKMENETIRNFNYYLNKDYALIFNISFLNIKVKNNVSVPYLSISKGKISGHLKADNGRLLSCDMLKNMAITEIDYKIILSQYTFEDVKINNIYYAKKKYICDEIRKQVLKYFFKKENLKGKDPYFYMKSKNKLNGIFGMYVTDPCKPEFYVNENHEVIEKDVDLLKALSDFYKSKGSFLSYQVGVYVTAYARKHLQDGIDLIDFKDFVYTDTDSVKFLHPEKYINKFNELNKKYFKICEDTKSYILKDNKKRYLGYFDHEGVTKYFKTYGAKKYILGNNNDDFVITISGVPKVDGKKQIIEDIKKGKLKNFYDLKKGYIFRNIKMTSDFNDYTEVKELKIDDKHSVKYASNIALYDANYTLGMANEYEILLEEWKDVI